MATEASAYIVPRKCILSKEQMEAFQASKTHEGVIGYIETLNEAVVGVKLTDDCEVSEVSIIIDLKFCMRLIAMHAIYKRT